MKLSTSFVAVKKINSNIDASHFSQEKLEQAANLILAAEGVINPLILQRLSRDSYQVVDGDFEYHAAIRAKEKDPLKGEMIGAFILDEENADTLKTQVSLLRKHQIISQNTTLLETNLPLSLIHI
jgi:ParB family chromosome partitioning protein